MKPVFLHLVSFAFLAFLSGGCAFNVKTSHVSNFEALEEAELAAMSRTDFEIAMGTPQSKGTHRVEEVDLEATYYHGMIGVMNAFPAQYANMDSGVAFVSFNEKEEVAELLYFLSRFDGPTIQMGSKHQFSIQEVADTVEFGVTTATQLQAVTGVPSRTGRRFNKAHGIEHTVNFYDTSSTEATDVMKERWLMAGYDDNGVIQDLLWVSSYAKDLASLGGVAPQKLKSMTRIDYSQPFVILTTESVSTSTKLDPVQVDALIRSSPDTIDEYVKVLGKPTAKGFKTFKEHEPWLISHWSYLSLKLVGNESGPVLGGVNGASFGQRVPNGRKVRETSYMVMDAKTTRLMIAHTPDGTVKEVIWVRPVQNPTQP